MALFFQEVAYMFPGSLYLLSLHLCPPPQPLCTQLWITLAFILYKEVSIEIGITSYTFTSRLTQHPTFYTWREQENDMTG